MIFTDSFATVLKSKNYLKNHTHGIFRIKSELKITVLVLSFEHLCFYLLINFKSSPVCGFYNDFSRPHLLAVGSAHVDAGIRSPRTVL